MGLFVLLSFAAGSFLFVVVYGPVFLVYNTPHKNRCGKCTSVHTFSEGN